MSAAASSTTAPQGTTRELLTLAGPLMLSNLAYTATQFALLTALSAVGRTYLSAGAGYVAQAAGWPDEEAAGRQIAAVYRELLGPPGHGDRQP